MKSQKRIMLENRLRNIIRPIVRNILTETISPQDQSLIDNVIDTHKGTKSGKMSLSGKAEYIKYKKVADKTGLLTVYSGFGGFYVTLSDEGVKKYNLTSK